MLLTPGHTIATTVNTHRRDHTYHANICKLLQWQSANVDSEIIGSLSGLHIHVLTRFFPQSTITIVTGANNFKWDWPVHVHVLTCIVHRKIFLGLLLWGPSIWLSYEQTIISSSCSSGKEQVYGTNRGTEPIGVQANRGMEPTGIQRQEGYRTNRGIKPTGQQGYWAKVNL